MALTFFGMSEKEKKQKFDRFIGRERIRLQRKRRRDFERLKMKGPQPKTGLRS